MINKVGDSAIPLTSISSDAVLANPVLIERMTKLAYQIKNLAPKSDDFLYFSIIFLKAAESSLIDERGLPKKVGNDVAWGYFDENYRWHGNVPPHKNNNCFLAGTKITMHDGSTKNIEDVIVGDYVRTHTGAVRKVTHTFINDYSGKTLSMLTRNNEWITCTPEHPFYSVDLSFANERGLRTVNKKAEKDSLYTPSFLFKEARDLRIGDILSSPILNDVIDDNDINENRARLLGIFAAEGSYSKKYGRRQGLLFTLGLAEINQANVIMDLIEKEFSGCSVKIRKEEKKSIITVTVTGSNIQEFVYKHIGEFSDKKKLSKNIVFATDSVKKAFITGWLDGDGCKTDFNKLVGITTSPDLANQVRVMLNSLYIANSLRYVTSAKKLILINKNYPEYAAKNHYRIEIPGLGYKALGMDKCSAKYSFDNKKSKKYNYFHGDYRLHSIRKIVENDFSGKVYNIEVEDDHSYIANGLAVHNCDIFSESELKKAAKNWIGMPLCKDHESSSVDGIRGIILDTHYDEKLKQVVGLCALDKINYPDLARKVQTGVVRYGSMGTAVETSICSECGNRAKTQKDYCAHITNKTAWGEINVGLKPIEYSLVVQPAEPGAVLLRCIASLNEYRQEFINSGIDDVDSMLGKLSVKQAEHLEKIMKTACGDSGCSIPERRRIISGFLENNGIIQTAELSDMQEREAAFAKAMDQMRNAIGQTINENPNAYKPLLEAFGRKTDEFGPSGSRPVVKTETFTSDESIDPNMVSMIQNGQGDVNDYTGMSGGMLASPTTSFDGSDGVGPEHYDAKNKLAAHSIVNQDNSNTDFYKKSNNNFDIKHIMEDIMNESRLRRRSMERRKVAYHQGGSDGVEPKGTYKAEKPKWEQDKHMQQTGKSMGGNNGMWKGDKEAKEKLLRAEDSSNTQTKTAYHFGGADGVEPKGTYKSEKPKWEQDKHMQQTGKGMGGSDGMWKGDKETKEKVLRAAYNGPALRTKFSQARTADGKINKSASLFEVYSGDKKVIAATAGEIFNDELDHNWDWVASREYGQEVCRQIRAYGLDHVGKLLKGAQAMPPAAPAPAAPAAPGEMPAMPEMPPMDMGGMPSDLGMGGADASEPADVGAEDPKKSVEDALVVMEEKIDEVRSLTEDLSGGQDVDIDINVDDKSGADAEIGGEPVKLSRNIVRQLKLALAQMDRSADELALLGDTYTYIGKLNASQKGEVKRITADALRDANHLIGEAAALTRVANAVLPMVKSAMSDTEECEECGAEVTSPVSYAEDMMDTSMMEAEETREADDMLTDESQQNELVQATLNLRRARRESMMKNAGNRILAERKARRENILKAAAKKKKDEKDPKDAKKNLKNLKKDEDKKKLDGKKKDVKPAKKAELDPQTAVKTASTQTSDNQHQDAIKAKLQETLTSKKASDDRDAYRLKLRRAYDVGLEMQRKGLVGPSKSALDTQVDEIMDFDDRAFEAFKRSVSNAKTVDTVKIASDLSGINIGSRDEEQVTRSTPGWNSLLKLWD